MPIPRERLRLTPDELNDLLTTERTMRVGTVGSEGFAHVVPLWFVWHDGTVWINNLKRSKRSREIEAGSPVTLCFDTGTEYFELRGAVLYGRPERVSADDSELPAVRKLFGDKYFFGIDIPDVKSHEWLKLVPTKTVSWDFRKIQSGPEQALKG